MANSTNDITRVASARCNVTIFASSPSYHTSDDSDDDDSYHETVTIQPASLSPPIMPSSTMATTSVISKTSTTHQSVNCTKVSNSTKVSQPARSKIFRKSNFVRRSPSPELGHGEWAIVRDSRGRPIRSNRPLDLSAKAPDIDGDVSSRQSNDEDEEEDEGLTDTDAFVPDTLRKVPDAGARHKMKYLKALFPHRSVQTITKASELWKGRAGLNQAVKYLAEYGDRPVVLGKRKRSESPAALPLDCGDDDAFDVKSEHTDEDTTLVNEVESVEQPQAPNHFPLHLTVNIPLGQQEPIILHLDPKSIAPTALPPARKPVKTLVVRLPIRAHGMKRVSTRKMEILKAFKKRVGFMNLAPELRNKIYRAALVAKYPLNFGHPTNLSLTAALLRTTRQIHSEARSILYSENHFVIERRSTRHGRYWTDTWYEVGFASARKFFQIIGPGNISLIRQLSLSLEDALPCMSPSTSTAETRRFVNDDNLMSVLRQLSKHAQLRELNLHFRGRRRVERTDSRFLERMKRVKADTVQFRHWYPCGWQDSGGLYARQEGCVRNMLLIACERRKKRFTN